MSYPIFTDFKQPLLFAHRGLSTKAPENTMTAFKLAWESGVPGIELDVRLCQTEEVVVIHDSLLERTTGEEGYVEHTDLKTLKSYTAGPNGEKIPLLSEVFEAAPDSTYFDIEMKVEERNAREMALALSKVISEYGMEGRCIISSFYPSGIREISIAAPGVPTALIYSEKLVKEHRIQHFFARWLSGTPVLKPEWTIMEESLRYLRRLIPWTVNDVEEAKRLIKLGAVGIISDDPTPLLTEAP